MPLTFATPPADASNALLSGLRDIRDALRGDPRGGMPLLSTAPMAMSPHPVYELNLTDLAEGKGLDAARLVAWRYLIVENEQIREAAEVHPDAAGGTRFGSLTTGHVAGAEKAFALAESLPEVAAGDYEIRALQVPALYVMSLWLKQLGGGEDRFVLLPPVFAPFRANEPIGVKDLLRLLRCQAEAALSREQRSAAHQRGDSAASPSALVSAPGLGG